MGTTRLVRGIAVSYGVLAYAAFLAALAWAVTFLADLPLPRGIDHGVGHPAVLAVGVDLALLLLFAVQHSVMARAGFKQWLSRRLPAPMERSTYVLATSVLLLLLFWRWQTLPRPVWELHNPASGVLWTLCALGWIIAIGSTFMIDHLDFLGLSRVVGYSRQKALEPGPFVERWLYAWVRHPLMLGLLLAFWATPRMSLGHLVFAAAATGYIAVGVRFEEHDLKRELGEVYNDYARRVPALLPIRRPSRSLDATLKETVDK
jgi:protein-S-isoprenylcysteine O-methyltransferase Ste14